MENLTAHSKTPNHGRHPMKRTTPLNKAIAEAKMDNYTGMLVKYDHNQSVHILRFDNHTKIEWDRVKNFVQLQDGRVFNRGKQQCNVCTPEMAPKKPVVCKRHPKMSVTTKQQIIQQAANIVWDNGVHYNRKYMSDCHVEFWNLYNKPTKETMAQLSSIQGVSHVEIKSVEGYNCSESLYVFFEQGVQ